MNVVRFEDKNGQVRYGEQIDNATARVIAGDLFDSLVRESLPPLVRESVPALTGETAEIRRLLAPVQPVNIIAIGLNYRRHAAESGAQVPAEPLVFVKLTTSAIAPGDPIVLPASAPDEVDYEGELAVIIGKTARKVAEADALKYVLGYTCANDVSARDCQIRRDKQWARGKGFDTFCPLGPVLLVDPAVNPNSLAIRTRLNGEIMQNSSTADMIFSVPFLVSYLSHQFTLLPGTVIVTGTPEGVGCARKPPVFLRPGDSISVEIERIGTLTNPVVADA